MCKTGSGRLLAIPSWYVIGIAVLGTMLCPPGTSVAGLHSCGQSITTGANPSASDALHILRVALDSILDNDVCPNCVCDATGNGSVLASDALLVLRKAVGQSVTLSCPLGECISCTDGGASLKTRLQNAQLSELIKHFGTWHSGSSLLFRCNNTTLNVDDNVWGAGPTVTASGTSTAPKLISDRVNGYDRNIVIALNPLCYQRCLGLCSDWSQDDNDKVSDFTCTRNAECSTGLCNGAGTCSGGTRNGEACFTVNDCPGAGTSCTDVEANIGINETACTGHPACANKGIETCSHDVTNALSCPGVNAGGARFISIAGNWVNVERFTVRGFFDGVQPTGDNNTVRNMILDRQCDDSISNSNGVGNEVRDTVIKSGCDKCAQDKGLNSEITSTTCPTGSERGCYHNAYHNVDFDGCKTPMRVTDQGTFLVSGGHMRKSAGLFECVGPSFTADNVNVDVQELHMDKCEDGFAVSGNSSRYDFRSNLIRRNNTRGMIVLGQAVVTARCNKIYKNGGCHTSGQAIYGAVGWETAAAGGSGKIYLGGTTSNADVGYNHIVDNKGREDMQSFNVEIDNYRESETIDARNNYWATGTNQPGDINEPADTSLPRASDPMTTPVGAPSCPDVPVPGSNPPPPGDCTTN